MENAKKEPTVEEALQKWHDLLVQLRDAGFPRLEIASQALAVAASVFMDSGATREEFEKIAGRVYNEIPKRATTSTATPTAQA